MKAMRQIINATPSRRGAWTARPRRRSALDLAPGVLLNLCLAVAIVAAYSIPELGVWIYR